MDKLGGVCLNRGCIPTKALLKSAHSVHEVSSFKDLGINVDVKSLDGGQAVRRASSISNRISKGVSFLMKKIKLRSLKVRDSCNAPINRRRFKRWKKRKS